MPFFDVEIWKADVEIRKADVEIKKTPKWKYTWGGMWKYQEKYLVFAGYLLHSCKFYVQSNFFELYIEVLDVVGVELWYKRAFC